jgi:predicted kinase
MTAVGSASTRLVILRGDSASGKTTTSHALRARLGGRTALIHQDEIRRELLQGGEKEERSAHAAVLIDGLARQSLDLGYDVILDGIFNLRDYAQRFEALARDHRGTTRVVQFDVGLDETLRRHRGRPLGAIVPEDDVVSWYDGWQPLPTVPERRITAELGTDEIVALVLGDLAAGTSSAARDVSP